MCFALGAMWLLFEFDAYIPTYLSDALGVSPAVASICGAAFPAGMVISTTGGGFLLDKLGRKRGNVFMFLSLCATLATIAMLWLLTVLNAMTAPLGVILSFLYGMTLGVPAYMPHSLFALRFGGADCATLLAVIDVFGWGSIIALDLSSRSLAGGEAEGSWTPLFAVLFAAGVVAVVLLGVFLWLDTRVYTREEAEKTAMATGKVADEESVAEAGSGSQRTSMLEGRSSLELRAMSGAGSEGT
jgi:sugar phosphate permease